VHGHWLGRELEVKLIAGTPMQSEDFAVVVSAQEACDIAWALIRFADQVPPENAPRLRDLSYEFANLTGEH
jgi:hypothetical protein